MKDQKLLAGAAAATIIGLPIVILTTRLASNEANGQAGDLSATGSNTRVICEGGSTKGDQGCPAGAPVQFVQHFPARASNTYIFTWRPPSRDVGDIRVRGGLLHQSHAA